MILANVTANSIAISNKELLVTGSSRTNLVQFSFSEDWDDLIQIAVFKTVLHQIALQIPSTHLLSIPWECYETIGDTVQIGCYGVNASNRILLPTVWSDLGSIVDGTDIVGSVRGTASDDIYSKLLNAVADLEREVQAMGSHMNLTDRNRASQHDISSITNLQQSLLEKEPLTNAQFLAMLGGSRNARQ